MMPTWSLHEGDCVGVMRSFEPDSVHCVVTSPPYWGLRDYGVEGQLGLEASPDEYVQHLVDVFDEVRRVLRPDGTLWLVLGDSYNAGREGGWAGGKHGVSKPENAPQRSGVNALGLKPKDLVGIPWRVAFALQAAGWWLRASIVWAKPNPMPESIRDRPTRSHEFVFLLTRSARYFYDGDAIRERGQPSAAGLSLADVPRNWDGRRDGTVPGKKGEAHASGTRTGGNLSRAYAGVDWAQAGRNARDVWTIPSEPFPGAHFATFPKALVEPCVKAGTSEHGCCVTCGAPWSRVVESTKYEPPVVAPGVRRVDESRADKVRKLSGAAYNEQVRRATTGWAAGCAHASGVAPGVVLDPFAGAGTTGLVALRLGRSFVGIELSPVYADLARERIHNDAPLFNADTQIAVPPAVSRDA